MQISSSYHPTTDRHLIQYDTGAQAAFQKACVPAELVFKSHVVQEIIKADSKLLQASLSIGYELLCEFAKNQNRKVEVSMLDLQAVCDLTMFTAGFLYDDEEVRASLPQVILLLANVTMYPVPPVSLPPAQEVFETAQLSPEAREGFEKIRCWADSGQPYLPLYQLYRIWFALKQIQPTNDQLRSLLKVLGLITEMFRTAMADQASIELAKNARKNTPKGSKS